MTDLRILTLHTLAATGEVDDRPLRAYLRDREVLRAEPFFAFHEGRPVCLVYLETRALQGADLGVPTPSREVSGLRRASAEDGADRRRPDEQAVDEAFQRLLSELDETERARYQRLLTWRRDTARARSLAPYILFSNRVALDLARRAPASPAALRQVKGLGDKRVAAHGDAILEVLHGTVPSGRPGPASALREVDGHDQVAAGTDAALPAPPAPHADRPDREPDPGVLGAGDAGGLPPTEGHALG
jgi:hypothetical protein